MSWLPRSIANSLLIDGEYEDEDHPPTTSSSHDHHINRPQSVKDQEYQGSDPQTLTGGVKGDISDFTESLARQLWDVASFLAPPPPPPPPPPPLQNYHSPTITTQPDPSRSGDDDGSNLICEDSKFRDGTGVSNSIFSNDDQEENDTAIVGVTEEVLAFATNIAHHPETWLDFPLSEEEDSDDFEMSDTQWNHATLVEDLIPRLAALRIELCPVHMSESYFWKVYFVLLHPRLNKHDADLLSTPQIVAARTMWMKELQMQTKQGPHLFEGNTSHMLNNHEDCNTSSSDSPSANTLETKTHGFEPTTHHLILKSEELMATKDEGLKNSSSDQRVVLSYRIPIEDFGDDDDDWILENSELDGYDGPDVPLGADEDISFSDLEDDECDPRLSKRNCA